MKRLLQINPVLRVSTSTGRIMQEIGELAMKNGWESYITYSRGRDGIRPCKSHLLPVGNKWSVVWHGLITRLFDRHGLESSFATRELIAQIETIKPDVIHIHNIHGYFLNYKLLFAYLAKCEIPIIWTVHDCWLYTGHCYHYSYAQCRRWQTSCGQCPQQYEFPASWLRDRSQKNFEDKRKAFTSIPPKRFTFVPVSEWMRDEMKHSFFRDYNFQVIHNGINTDLFCPRNGDYVRKKYGIREKHVLLGVASIWNREKGLPDFIKLASLLNKDERIVLVGVSRKDAKRLPQQITGIARTENIEELAALYAVADVFVNLTWQDNYPTVNMEAISCGTPVVTYRTGGSVESVTEKTGFVVEQGNIEGVMKVVRIIGARGKDTYTDTCREYALNHFKKEDRYRDYIKLYEKVTSK